MWTVPNPTNGVRKVLLKGKYILSGLASNLNRDEVIFEWDTFKIVEMDVLGNEPFHLGTGRKAGAVQTFRFQGVKEVFHRRAVVWASGASHRRRNVACLCQVEVCLKSVLRRWGYHTKSAVTPS